MIKFLKRLLKKMKIVIGLMPKQTRKDTSTAVMTSVLYMQFSLGVVDLAISNFLNYLFFKTSLMKLVLLYLWQAENFAWSEFFYFGI